MKRKKPFCLLMMGLCMGLSPGSLAAEPGRGSLLSGHRGDEPGTVIEAASPAAAETSERAGTHPIDRQVETLLAKDESTAGQNHAFEEGERLWDTELNRLYRELSARLDEVGRKRLREAQRAWLAFRDAEFVRLGDQFGRKEGTMFGPMLAAARMELVKARAREMADALGILDM
ncbi:MAG TPA: DUF1311 domain-containing protein [Candidatus Ozemobacteraceae bacterium]|nr:DUF1311 domain-containing protein [Candidatus Ozemobacteraceae bacterium]